MRMLPGPAGGRRACAGPDVGRLQREGTLRLGGRTVRLEEVSEPRPGQSVAVVMDTRRCDGALELARGRRPARLRVDVPARRRGPGRAVRPPHGPAGRGAAAEAGARRLVLTHFSQRYGDDGEPFGREAREAHDDVVVAEDGMRVAVPRRR